MMATGIIGGFLAMYFLLVIISGILKSGKHGSCSGCRGCTMAGQCPSKGKEDFHA